MMLATSRTTSRGLVSFSGVLAMPTMEPTNTAMMAISAIDTAASMPQPDLALICFSTLIEVPFEHTARVCVTARALPRIASGGGHSPNEKLRAAR